MKLVLFKEKEKEITLNLSETYNFMDGILVNNIPMGIHVDDSFYSKLDMDILEKILKDNPNENLGTLIVRIDSSNAPIENKINVVFQLGCNAGLNSTKEEINEEIKKPLLFTSDKINALLYYYELGVSKYPELDNMYLFLLSLAEVSISFGILKLFKLNSYGK